MGAHRPKQSSPASNSNDVGGDAAQDFSRTIYDGGRLRALFDEMSGTYGVVNFLSSFGFTRRWRRQCVELAQLKAGDRVCDLMTGMGECWDEILKGIGREKGTICAVDFSPAMIAAARQRLSKYPGVEVYERDVFDPAFARDALATENPGECRFDAIVCCFGVKTLEPRMYARLVELCRRLLKPGGRFSFVEISVPSAAILRWPLQFYLRYLIPWIGRLCLGNPDNYRMLGVYTRAFGDCARLHASFADAGCDARYHRLFFGSATAVSGTVPG
ncbi:MAG: class I SAM-dependent methyltransferase [bacterium]|nr:class I SAM-dependent methyltransferase [bacterium]